MRENPLLRGEFNININMPLNDHKKVLLELSTAYKQVHEEGFRDLLKRKKDTGSKEEAPPEEKPKVSRGVGQGYDQKTWSADVDPDDISAKRKSGKSYEDRKRSGLVTKADQQQLRRDKQGEWGDKFKDYAKQLGAANAEGMDDYGYSDEDYAEPTHSEYHPDNIERQSNPRHDHIIKKGVSDKYTPEDFVLDHNGKRIRRKDINGGRDRVIKPGSQHQRNESTMIADNKLQHLIEAYNNVFNK